MAVRQQQIANAVSENGGIIAGSTLARVLGDTMNITPENARQIIKRTATQGKIIRYDLGQDSIYALTPIGPDTPSKVLLSALADAHPGLARVCRVLYSSLALSLGEALKISGARASSPTSPPKEEPLFKYLLTLDIIDSNFIEKYEFLVPKPPLTPFTPSISGLLAGRRRVEMQRSILDDVLLGTPILNNACRTIQLSSGERSL